MLIVRFEEPHVLALRISGELDSDSWAEGAERLREALAQAKGRRVVADIGDLKVGNAIGARLIRTFSAQGLEFSVVPDNIAVLLDEAAAEECSTRCNRVQRACFRVARFAASAPVAIRRWVCDLLRRVLPREFVARRLRSSKLCQP